MNVRNLKSVVGAALLAASLSAHASSPDESGNRLERTSANADPAIGPDGESDGGAHLDRDLPSVNRGARWGMTTQIPSNEQIASVGEWDRDRPDAFDRSFIGEPVAFGLRIVF